MKPSHLLFALMFCAPVASRAVVTGLAPVLYQQSAADSIARAAQGELNNGNFRRAADMYASLVRRFPNSPRAADATYYRAFALFRIGGRSDLTTALDELDRYDRSYRNGNMADDARSLRMRVCGEMARTGDERCGKEVVERATTATTAPPGTAARPRAGGNRAGPGSGPGSAASSNKGDDDDERMMALNALMQMNAAQAVPILKGVLARRDAGSAKLREQAVFLIAQKQSGDAVDVLLDVAKNDPDADVRSSAVFWLSQTGDARAVDVLQDLLLKSNDHDVRDKAIFSLSQIKGDRSRQILRDFATKPGGSLELRQQAIFWLGQGAGPEGVKYLRDLYGQLTEHDLKDAILTALAQSRGGRPALLEIAQNTREEIELRGQAVFWLAQSGGTAADLAALYATATDREFKNKIIFGLTQMRDADAVDKLIDIAKTDKDHEVRSQAVFWLGQSKDPRAAKFIVELIGK